MKFEKLESSAKNIKKNLLKAIYEAASGHPGGSLSAVEILTYLYFKEMNIDEKNPEWDERDKFVLSKGHAAPVLYATLAERGFFKPDDIMTLRKIGSKFQGHPSKDKVSGVEMSTGSLGQGFSAAIGMAIASKLDKKHSKTYVLLGDGELQEGIVWEAAMAANHYNLANLTAIIDWNGLQIDGKNDDVMTVKPIDEKFRAFGWDVITINGHDFKEIESAFEFATKNDKPTVIIAKTHKGNGVSFMSDNASWHGKAPNEEELKQALLEIEGE